VPAFVELWRKARSRATRSVGRRSRPRPKPPSVWRMGVFAEFERAMIQERVRAGLRRAMAQGTKSGNGRPKVEAATEAAIRMAPVKGDRGMRKIAADLSVGVGTVQHVPAELKAA
jgi:DNA invertase Pin-like site-specific DNA recombinase